MSLFGKKDKIPEIPLAPEVPRIMPIAEPKPSETIPAIPSLPKKPVETLPSLPAMSGDGRDQLNRDVIKSAIEDSSEKMKGDTSGASAGSMKGFEESSMQVGIPALPPQKMEKEVKPEPLVELKKIEVVPSPPARVEMPKVETVSEEQKGVVKKDAEETIFVRIDKFNSAKRDVQEISRDLREVEEVLSKIEEIKLQEDEEITEISKVMDEIKLRMTRIDNDVFNRI
ncbi:Uncharacterised protein [uncultured archaeon]|nr:Uncharacterised protein [uncultured archaeon]